MTPTSERRSGGREDFITLTKFGEALHPEQGVGHALISARCSAAGGADGGGAVAGGVFGPPRPGLRLERQPGGLSHRDGRNPGHPRLVHLGRCVLRAPAAFR